MYRFDGAHAHVRPCDLADATHLVATTRETTWTDETAEPGERYTYVVTALDRAYRESRGGLVVSRAVPMVHDVR